jgi:hypothetical protein
MLMKIKSVKYVCDYKLKLLFSDKKTKIVDFENWIKEGGTYLLPLNDVQGSRMKKSLDSQYLQ